MLCRNVGWGAIVAVLALVGCAVQEFDPPDHPPHTKKEDGYLHVPRFEQPFLCGVPGDPESEKGAPCPTQRPIDDLLSCDASGCHGTFEFDQSRQDLPRDLRGSDGPSCYTCHGDEWKDGDEKDEKDEEDEK